MLARSPKVERFKPLALLDEHQTGQPSGGQAQRWKHSGENRVLVVLPAQDDPHIISGFFHQLGKQFVYPLNQQVVDDLILFF